VITEAAFFGGSQELAPVVDFDIVPQVGRLVLVTPGAAALVGLLPDARRFPHTGGPIAWVANLGAQTFTIKDHSGTVTVVAVAAGKVGKILLRDNTTSDGLWAGYIRTRLT